MLSSINGLDKIACNFDCYLFGQSLIKLPGQTAGEVQAFKLDFFFFLVPSVF